MELAIRVLAWLVLIFGLMISVWFTFNVNGMLGGVGVVATLVLWMILRAIGHFLSKAKANEAQPAQK